MLKHLFVIGYPSDIGGANTELWHTVKLWRQFGLGVTLIPTGEPNPKWQKKLDEIGCQTVVGGRQWAVGGGVGYDDKARLQSEITNLKSQIPLPGSVVVAFCNEQFLAAADRFRAMGCRIVWLGCMNWLFPAERLHYARRGCFDRHVFQSQYQREQLVPQLRRFGYRDEQGAVIRGALDADEFPFRPLPHAPGKVFTIGRISRAAADKFSPQTWRIYDSIRQELDGALAEELRNGCHAVSVAYPCAGKHGIPTTGKLRLPHGTHTFRNRNYLLEQSPLRARVLGWNAAVEARVGPPPAWAECLPPGSSTPQEFLATLGALVHAGGTAAENWPRAGLEAMAAGVPVVADRRGGWPEMIRHGETGYLCDDDRQFACYTARLACDEPHRLAIIRRARQAVESELANSAAIWAAWRQLFEGLDR